VTSNNCRFSICHDDYKKNKDYALHVNNNVHCNEKRS